jgi:hypothetical protein
MSRRVIRLRLEVRDRFEATRLGQQCLREAYACLVPPRCETTTGKARGEMRDRTASPVRRYGGKHG